VKSNKIKLIEQSQKVKSKDYSQSLVYSVGKIKINNIVIETYLADSQFLREKGLQFINNLPSKSAMFFIFPYPKIVKMHNRNLLFDIDIIFVDGEYKIREIKSLNSYKKGMNTTMGKTRYIFALETHKGFCEKNNISVGDRITLINL